ncbi:MAG: hypothetical protein ABI977_17520 [Acidobacteriota bacterium]
MMHAISSLALRLLKLASLVLAAALPIGPYSLSAEAQTECKINGKVSDQSGKPVKDVRIYQATSPFQFYPPDSFLAVTDEQGKWSAPVCVVPQSPSYCNFVWLKIAPIKPGYIFTNPVANVCGPFTEGQFSAAPAKFTGVSAASFNENMALGSIVSLFGSNLTNVKATASSQPLPTELSGVKVVFQDMTTYSQSNNSSMGYFKPAPLFFVSDKQINLQIPADVPNPVVITVRNEMGNIFAASAFLFKTAPGVFSADMTGRGAAAAVVLRVKSDSSTSYEPVVVFNSAQNRFDYVPINVGFDTEEVFLVLFGTGIRKRSSMSTVTAKVGGVDAEVFYAAEQGYFSGLDQVNVQLPHTLAGRGEVDIELSVESQKANPVKVSIR